MSRTAKAFAAAAGLLGAVLGLAVASNCAVASEPCGTGTYPFPYTDVASVTDPFCPGIMEAYVTGVSKGTTPTTFSPNNTVTRVQMTTFLERSLDQGLTRASRRAALNQWWNPQISTQMQAIALGPTQPYACGADGEYIWTSVGNDVIQVQGSTGAIVGTWTNANSAGAIQVANGKVYVTGNNSPGSLYVIDPTQAPGPVTTAVSTLTGFPGGIAFDGTHLWTANYDGSVSIITPQATTPYPVSTVTTGFTHPQGILYDGANIWVTDYGSASLFKLDAGGTILQTVPVGNWPAFPAFDGANIWVPNYLDNTVTVVQASTGNVVATLVDVAGSIHCPNQASFDGERMFLTNHTGDSVTVFKAADLSVITNVPMGLPPSTFTSPAGACSDGINFWFTVTTPNSLLRF